MFAVAAMFFFLYSDEVGGHKNAIKKWLEAAKIDPIFRRKFVFLVYFMIVLFRTLFNRDMWSNPLSNIVGEWSFIDENGNYVAEIPENIIMFIPFMFLILNITHYGFKKKIDAFKLVVKSLRYSFIFSLCIECCQLFFRLGTFQLSDLFFNTIGGLIGGMCFWVIKRVDYYLKNRKVII